MRYNCGYNSLCLVYVVRGNNSEVIEVRVRPKDAQWRYRLDVLAGGKRVYFDRSALKFQHFSGVVVYTPTYILNQSEIIIMFDTGAGLEVVENEGFLSLRTFLPWTYMVSDECHLLLLYYLSLFYH